VFSPEQVLATPQLLNPYSYVANNPVVYVDPTGEIAMVAPLIAPALYTTGVATIKATGVALVAAAAYVAFDSFDPDTLETGTIQPTKQELLETPPPYQDPDDFKEPRNNLPRGQKWLYATLVGGAVGYGVYDQYQEQKSGVKTFKERSQPQQSSSQKPTIRSGPSKSSSSNNSSPRYGATASSLQAASRALDSGDYSSARRYLQQASESLSN
jgi:hypothetical protein